MEGLPAQNLTRKTTTKRHPAHPLDTLLTLQLYHSVRQVDQGLFEPVQVSLLYLVLNSPKLQIRPPALLSKEEGAEGGDRGLLAGVVPEGCHCHRAAGL